MRIEGMPSPISSTQNIQRPVEPIENTQSTGSTFGEHIQNAVDNINNLQSKASEMVEQVVTGQTDEIHKAMIAMEQASLSFNFGLQVRNKALDAYQEIMKTQL
jgi:flagellar hook-basal body complex protein FliE